MEQYRTLVANIHHFEALAQTRLGATGASLSEIARSVEDKLPEDMYWAMVYLSTMERDIKRLGVEASYPNYATLQKKCGQIQSFLERLPEVIPESTWDQYQTSTPRETA